MQHTFIPPITNLQRIRVTFLFLDKHKQRSRYIPNMHHPSGKGKMRNAQTLWEMKKLHFKTNTTPVRQHHVLFNGSSLGLPTSHREETVRGFNYHKYRGLQNSDIDVAHGRCSSRMIDIHASLTPQISAVEQGKKLVC